MDMIQSQTKNRLDVVCNIHGSRRIIGIFLKGAWNLWEMDELAIVLDHPRSLQRS